MKFTVRKVMYLISILFLILMGSVDAFLLPHNLDTGGVLLRNTAAFCLLLFALIPVSWDLITRLPKFIGFWVSTQLLIMVLLGYSPYEKVGYSKWFFPALYANVARGILLHAQPLLFVCGFILAAIIYGIHRLVARKRPSNVKKQRDTTSFD